ncbi:MAG: hypothetical protein ACOYO1_13685 [Bacteroidales bacterium]
MTKCHVFNAWNALVCLIMGWKTEVRSQKSEVGRWKMEDGRQKSVDIERSRSNVN